MLGIYKAIIKKICAVSYLFKLGGTYKAEMDWQYDVSNMDLQSKRSDKNVLKKKVI